MMKRIVAIVGLLLFILFFGGQGLSVAELIIKNGGTLTLNDSDIYLNCDNLAVLAGGVLDLGSGTIHDCGYLVELGTIEWNDGEILYCPGGGGGSGGCFMFTVDD